MAYDEIKKVIYGDFLCPKCGGENRFAATPSPTRRPEVVTSHGNWEVRCRGCRTKWLIIVAFIDLGGI